MKFTNHAIKRLSERFPTLNEGIKSLFKESIVMVSRKDETFFLNQKHRIVFVVRKRSEDNKYQVRTVLTEQQYNRNQVYKKIKARLEKEEPSLSEDQLKTLAKECLETRNFCYPDKKKRKEIATAMRLKGIIEKDIKLFWNYMMDMNYQIRHKKCNL